MSHNVGDDHEQHDDDDHDDQVLQHDNDDGAVAGAGADYSSVAERTVANIRRLQDNVCSQYVQSSAVSQSGSAGVSCQYDQFCLQSPDQCSPDLQPPDNLELVSLSPLRVNLPSPPPSPRPVSTTGDQSPSTCTQDPHWQSLKSSVRERNSAMFNNPLMADIVFVVGPAGGSKRVPAHRYVLATGSTVFYAMLYGGLADQDAEEIVVPDVDPEAFLAMLKYLYCDEIHLDQDSVLATLYAAKKYIVPHLARECVKYLETSLTAKNACLLLSQARLFEEPELMQRCWDVIGAQAEIALMSEGFTDIDFNTLLTILNRETLNCSELSVFLAAREWARAECVRREEEDTADNMRRVLGSAMQCIRFPCMNLQQFADSPAQSGMLSLQETTDIFLNFTAKQKPPVEYPTNPRLGMKPLTCHRFQSSAYRSNQWRYRGRCDSIQFCVDRRIFIVGFGMYGSSNGSADYTVRIQLKHSGKVMADNTQKFQSDGSSNTFPVYFDHPVQIEPDKSYTASAVLDGAELSYFGQEGLSEVVISQAQSLTFMFQCSADSTNGTGVQGGQIPEIIFYGPSPMS